VPAILDYSQVAVSVIVQEVAATSLATSLDEGLIRHMILNAVRAHVVRNRDYGEFVIACDGGFSWRRRMYPQYKCRRRRDENRDDGINWTMLFDTVHDVRDALKAHFPLKVIHVDGAEADDVIGVAVRRWASEGKPVRIISGDKDFQQLQRFSRVSQYSPTKRDPITKRNEEIVCADPVRFLGDHVLRGDSGDDVPNVVSDDLVFSDGRRQNPVTEKMALDWHRYWGEDGIDDGFFAEYQAGKIWHSVAKKGIDVHELKRRVDRNINLIDLSRTPAELTAQIEDALDNAEVADLSETMMYLASKGLDSLMGSVTDFVQPVNKFPVF